MTWLCPNVLTKSWNGAAGYLNKVWCSEVASAVVGVAYKGTTANSVSIPSNYVDQFRDAVKAKYADSHLKGIASSNLLVYADKTAFDANTADVPTNLQPEDDIGVYGAKDAKMYVVVPDGRSEYSISTCPRSKKTLRKQQLGFGYSAVSVNEVVDDSVHGYQWPALPEKHPDQRKAYMKYVEENLRDALISSRKQKDFLKDVAGKRDLLDCDDRSRLLFKVKGTADMMIIDELANRMDDVFAGHRVVIEVKKDRPSYNERWQLLSDLKSEGRCAPLGLLTNLNDYWYFLWFTPDNKIARMVLTCPANGFKTMKEVLKERSGPTRNGHFPMRVSFLGSPLQLKRQKLLRSASGRDDAAEELLERYELMSDERTETSHVRGVDKRGAS
ncbi:unnamed protein product [Phytophthora lilii]|uniref:Unnamed protein product n=1 Tax=Phytophthora lilii TaxID=2077276 RepID=A0A9W6X5H1_9STRA|nr:unnamed protein product [Phytophthora lilii]